VSRDTADHQVQESDFYFPETPKNEKVSKSKVFFFEKKNQKTFALGCRAFSPWWTLERKRRFFTKKRPLT
jgi:hypothetical protein